MKPNNWFPAASRPFLIALAMLTLTSAASAEWKEKVLYSFQGGTDGQLPGGGVIFDKAGNLYGLTILIGVGSNITSAGFTLSTTLVAQRGFSGSAMMSFCPAACTGIGVENLTLNGGSQAIDGIDNANPQDLTYVDHVGLYRILGTGLSISGNAKKSRPYTNITFDLGGASGSSLAQCASIKGLISTRGIHRLSCNFHTNDASAAVLLDSSRGSQTLEEATNLMLGARSLAFYAKGPVLETPDCKEFCLAGCPCSWKLTLKERAS
jgi:hypothetical protein